MHKSEPETDAVTIICAEDKIEFRELDRDTSEFDKNMRNIPKWWDPGESIRIAKETHL